MTNRSPYRGVSPTTDARWTARGCRGTWSSAEVARAVLLTDTAERLEELALDYRHQIRHILFSLPHAELDEFVHRFDSK